MLSLSVLYSLKRLLSPNNIDLYEVGTEKLQENNNFLVKYKKKEDCNQYLHVLVYETVEWKLHYNNSQTTLSFADLAMYV
jgi:hypothetical protein